ncbi:MAG: hypothetical protein HY290_17550 [Planctomycetia bacterium]|nr:hypothetical protein [Planctomycetia bacterium]
MRDERRVVRGLWLRHARMRGDKLATLVEGRSSRSPAGHRVPIAALRPARACDRVARVDKAVQQCVNGHVDGSHLRPAPASGSFQPGHKFRYAGHDVVHAVAMLQAIPDGTIDFFLVDFAHDHLSIRGIGPPGKEGCNPGATTPQSNAGRQAIFRSPAPIARRPAQARCIYSELRTANLKYFRDQQDLPRHSVAISVLLARNRTVKP